MSTRNLNTLKASRVLPFNVKDIFKTLCDGAYRQSYDPNIAETTYEKRICANVTALY
jgi:hypothetical protein